MTIQLHTIQAISDACLPYYFVIDYTKIVDKSTISRFLSLFHPDEFAKKKRLISTE
jgi:hypothetical protein